MTLGRYLFDFSKAFVNVIHAIFTDKHELSYSLAQLPN